MEDELDDLRHRIENLERCVKEMGDDNKQLLSHLKQVNKLNDLLLIKLNKDQANNNEANKSSINEYDIRFLHYQSQSLANIDRLKQLSKRLDNMRRIDPI